MRLGGRLETSHEERDLTGARARQARRELGEVLLLFEFREHLSSGLLRVIDCNALIGRDSMRVVGECLIGTLEVLVKKESMEDAQENVNGVDANGFRSWVLEKRSSSSASENMEPVVSLSMSMSSESLHDKEEAEEGDVELLCKLKYGIL